MGLPTESVPAVEAVDGVDFASPIGVLPARFNDSFTNAMIGVDTDRLSDVYRFDWVNGDDALLGELGTNGALVEKEHRRERRTSVPATRCGYGSRSPAPPPS